MLTTSSRILIQLALLGASHLASAQDNTTAAPVTSPPVPAPTTSSPVTPAPVASPTLPPATAAPVPAPVQPTNAPVPPPTPKPTVYNTPAPTPWAGIKYVEPEPDLRWSTKLPGTGGDSNPAPRKGNAVAVSPDDAFVYVTTDDGKLTVLNAQDGTETGSYDPNIQAFFGSNIKCESGVSFGRVANVGPFAVYAINYQVAGVDKSRVIAVSHPYGNQLWTSSDLDGIVMGTPQVGDDGRYVYLVRNVNDVGHFTLLRTTEAADSAGVLYTEQAGLNNVNETGKYAPLALVKNPNNGQFDGGNRNSNDVAAWGHYYMGGEGVAGYTRVFQLPQDFTTSSDGSVLATQIIDEVAWSTWAKPTISSNGLSIFYAITRGELRGWYNNKWGRKAWKGETAQDPTNGRTPVPNSAALSNDGTMLFSASATNSFHRIDAASGNVTWTAVTATEVVTEPRVSPDDTRVYTIQQGAGVVTAHDVSDGTAIWTTKCDKYQNQNPFCQYGVEAEFSVSSTGYYLYYSDNRGTVVALELGGVPPPTTMAPTGSEPTTAAPSASPSSTPTSMPTAGPTMAPVPTAMPTAMPTPIQPWTRPPSAAPTAEPTVEPTAEPTVESTSEPTSSPATTEEPTASPTSEPTVSPSEEETDPPVGADIASGAAGGDCGSWASRLAMFVAPLAYLLVA
eukprot:CAMPEP_0197436880 /NCGR_PEP_ID=MMETSP1175-20131217/4234_1 /TAXON_ID=1003142 /ORGANISM="Triceratium dubium, Strain CCMP147" /LENGTH=675 /DNA_ID=CAMNT_0042966271 /DNA_START=276 /DNA_END=2303 /DNA_ORIENTATION=-